METSLELILKKIERIEETLTGQLQGGFSSVPPTPDSKETLLRNTNCKGANCIIGCGPTYNKVAGCGVKK